jgi:hypothetical protein
MADFITNGSSVLPVVKTNTRSPSGAATQVTAEDLNLNRQALIDLRAACAPVVNAKTAFGAGGTSDDTAAVRSALAAGAGGVVYFPAGIYTVDVHTTWLAVASGTTVVGDGDSTIFRIKANSGSYAAIFSSTGGVQWTPTTDVKFRDFCIDQNVANNGFDIHDWVLAETAAAIYFNYVTGLAVDRVTFINTCSVHTVAAIGYAYVHDVKVRNCRFSFRHSGAVDYDNSAIYIDGTDFKVIGNTLVDTAMAYSRGAIEVHGGPGTVLGNTTDGYRDGCNVCRTATDVPNGVTQTIANRVDVAITGNTFSKCGTGIRIQPLLDAADVFDGLTIGGNLIHLNNVDRAYNYPTGIDFVRGASWTGAFENIAISGNTLVAQADVANGSVSTDSAGISIRPYGRIRGVSITGNVVRGFPAFGIRCYAEGGSRAVDIKGNLFADCGNDAALANYNRSAIYAYGGATGGGLTDFVIEGNSIVDTATVFGGYNSILIPAGGTWNRVIIRRNHVGAGFTTSIAAETGISTDLVAHADVASNITLVDLVTNYNSLKARLRAAGVLAN